MERNDKLATFASAFENERCYKTVAKFKKSKKKKEFFEKITINREVVVQEASFTSLTSLPYIIYEANERETKR